MSTPKLLQSEDYLSKIPNADSQRASTAINVYSDLENPSHLDISSVSTISKVRKKKKKKKKISRDRSADPNQTDR